MAPLSSECVVTRVATKALLNLEYTPSPSLLPVQSQLKIYLNDELMDVLPITSEQLGKKSYARVTLNPLYMKDFNRVRVGVRWPLSTSLREPDQQ